MAPLITIVKMKYMSNLEGYILIHTCILFLDLITPCLVISASPFANRSASISTNLYASVTTKM